MQIRRRILRLDNFRRGTPLLKHVRHRSPLGKMPSQVAVRGHHRGDNPPSGDESRLKSVQLFSLKHAARLLAPGPRRCDKIAIRKGKQTILSAARFHQAGRAENRRRSTMKNTVEKELLGLEKQYWQALKEKDVD